MHSADMRTLEAIGIAELVTHADRWVEHPDPTAPADRGGDGASDTVARLEQLGLVQAHPHRAPSPRGGVRLTPAGAEALSYLAVAR